MNDDDKKLDELETQLVPTPDIDLSVPANEPEADTRTHQRGHC